MHGILFLSRSRSSLLRLQDGLLGSQTLQALRQVVAPKLAGLTNLGGGGGGGCLRALLSFSSIAGVLGSAGQGPYAAANAAMDAWTEAASAQVRSSMTCYTFNFRALIWSLSSTLLVFPEHCNTAVSSHQIQSRRQTYLLAQRL